MNKRLPIIILISSIMLHTSPMDTPGLATVSSPTPIVLSPVLRPKAVPAMGASDLKLPKAATSKSIRTTASCIIQQEQKARKAASVEDSSHATPIIHLLLAPQKTDAEKEFLT